MLMPNYLILFIIRAMKNNSDANKTVQSFTVDTPDGKRSLISQAIMAENVQHTQRLLKKMELEVNFGWYGVLYDNEHISEGLRHTLVSHLKGTHDVLQVIKKMGDGGMVQSPRFFRRKVALLEESLMPTNLQDLTYSLVMDGWIKPHV